MSGLGLPWASFPFEGIRHVKVVLPAGVVVGAVVI
jgi:hypothetical protein